MRVIPKKASVRIACYLIKKGSGLFSQEPGNLLRAWIRRNLTPQIRYQCGQHELSIVVPVLSRASPGNTRQA